MRGSANEGALHFLVIDGDVIGHVAFGEFSRGQNGGELLGLAAQFDHIAVLHLIGRDIDLLAVDQHMTVIDDLARGENGRREFHAIDDGIQAAFQQLDQNFAVVALAAHSFLVIAAELTFADIAVIAAQLLLGDAIACRNPTAWCGAGRAGRGGIRVC